MRTQIRLLAAATLTAGMVLVGGCSPNTGYVIRPVPMNEQLEETVIASDPGWFVNDKIVIVDVEGVLMNTRSDGLLGRGENPVSQFIEKIDKAQRDPDVRAVVLRINSPGGGVTASDIMYHKLEQFRRVRKDVPVVAIVEDVGASGAYYIACGSHFIMAHPTSVTGSIGVIVEQFSFAGSLQKLGITTKAVKSGKMKDMGSPLKPIEDADVEVVQTIVMDLYGRFLEVVAKGRPKLSKEKIRELADGRVYSGDQAKANGLVDELGYMSDAIRKAREMSGTMKVKVVMYHRPLGYVANAYSASPNVAPQVSINVNAAEVLDMTRPQLLYLWTGK